MPVQFGYTLPETQLFTGNGSTTVFNLSNYVDSNDATNAIVEVNGVRVDNASGAYTISPAFNNITFTSAPTGNVAVTTYNLTDYQYFNSQFSITNNIVANITSVNNAISSAIVTQATATAVSPSNQITVTSTSGFVAGQTVTFQGTGFGNIATDGTVYLVKQVVDLTHFTISDQSGTIVPLSNDSGLMQVNVGGLPAVRVTTGIAHGLSTNNIVRIDGVNGSTQLNNNTYYVHVISTTVFDLYTSTYSSALNYVNSPVTTISSYTGGGYVWLDGSFILSDTTISATTNLGQITVGSTAEFYVGTPIYFTAPYGVLGSNLYGTGLISGQEYYVAAVVDATTFFVSSSRYGAPITLSAATLNPATQILNVCQWQQSNPDRLWVTINGYRVPSSQIKINAGNYISILSVIQTSDKIAITSMTPSATPNTMTYYLNVDNLGLPTVYNANATKTWLTVPLGDLDSTIYVNDVTQVTQTIVQNSIAPAINPTYNARTISLNADKNSLNNITVSVTKGGVTTVLPTSDYYYELIALSPYVFITSNLVSTGDSLTITILEGKTIFVNGEQIRFTTVNGPVQAGYIVKGQTYTINSIGTTDFTKIGASSNTVGLTFVADDNNPNTPIFTQLGSGSGTALGQNSISGIQRGANGTAKQTYIPLYTGVYGLLSSNLLPTSDYNQTWNPIPGVYNVTNGDPLQIANTSAAVFLQSD